MLRETIRNAFRERGCQAYQADFAAEFLSEGSAQHHLLVTPNGLGKVRSVSLIANRMVEEGRARRVLVIVPGACARLWQAQLERYVSDVPVKFLHTQAFREIQEATAAEGSPWPEAIVAIVPGDAAVKAPLMHALLSAQWDLLVLAETRPRLEYRVSELFQQLLAQGVLARSIVIAGRSNLWPQDAIEYGVERPRAAAPKFHVTDWFGELADWNGRTVTAKPVSWSVRDYCRNDAEVAFLRMLQEQLGEVTESRSPFRFQTDVLLRRAASSPLAGERTLDTIYRKLSRSLLRASVTRPEHLYGDPVEVEDLTRPSYTPVARKSYLRFLRNAFHALESVPVDTKRACLLQLVEELIEEQPGKICILAAYADTVDYLREAVSSLRADPHVVTGGLKYAKRQQLMKSFVEGGRVLLATLGALGEESDLTRVKHVILYDIPMYPHQLTQLEGRFGRINRARRCHMYALRDSSGVHVDPLLAIAVPRAVRQWRTTGWTYLPEELSS